MGFAVAYWLITNEIDYYYSKRDLVEMLIKPAPNWVNYIEPWTESWLVVGLIACVALYMLVGRFENEIASLIQSKPKDDGKTFFPELKK